MSDDSSTEAFSPPSTLPPPPEGSTIEVVERTNERMVLFIPAGAKRGREIGCFAIIWLTIVTVISAALANGVRQANGPGLGQLFFLVPFWLVGLTMLYFALRMRHTRTIVLIEPARAVLQQTFLGRTKTRETTLSPGEPATLVESYRQNDVPVDAVSIPGAPRALKFGTPLTDTEKEWLVDQINGFLGVQPHRDVEEVATARFPELCAQCGGTLGTAAAANDLNELTCPYCGHVHRGEITLVTLTGNDSQPAIGEFPADRVQIEEQSSGQLIFSMRAFDNSGMRRGAGAAFGLFALFWNAIVGTFVWSILFGRRFGLASLIPLLFMLPFLAVGVAIATVALFLTYGRLRVVLDRDRLSARWGIGPLGYTKSLATTDITHVTVQNSPWAVKNSARRRGSAEADTRTAIVWADNRWIPVTMLQGVNDCRHVATLVRRQLADMGITVEDRRVAPEPVFEDASADEDLDDDDDTEPDDQA